MPKPHARVVIAALATTLGGCADLVVTQTQVVWNADLKVATATVRNQGWAASTPTAPYFDGDESPESANDRAQVQAELPTLARGQSVTRLADVAPLARAENAFLGNVQSITVRANPKNLVRELDEGNNVATRSIAASAGTCIDCDALATGTVYGTPFQQAPGTVVLTQGAVQVSVENFPWTNGGTGHNRAQVAPASAAFGSGQVLRVNNINPTSTSRRSRRRSAR